MAFYFRSNNLSTLLKNYINQGDKISGQITGGYRPNDCCSRYCSTELSRFSASTVNQSECCSLFNAK